MSEKIYRLTKEKVAALQSELAELKTDGRKEIADSLDWLRGLPNDKDDTTFSDVFEEQRFLEKRISEIKEILLSYELIENAAGSDVVEIGTIVKVGFDRYEEEYMIVTAMEADPVRQKISDESPVGKALLGHRVGDLVKVDMGIIVKEYRVLGIK